MTCQNCEQLQKQYNNDKAMCAEHGKPYYLARIDANTAMIALIEKENDRCRKIIEYYGLERK